MKEMIKLESFYWIRLFYVLYFYAYDANYVHCYVTAYLILCVLIASCMHEV